MFVTVTVCFTLLSALYLWIRHREKCLDKELSADNMNLVTQHRHEKNLTELKMSQPFD
jgi:hypothetical protein